ncbi:MAG: SDR family NAD(P)-dependent oxidoreductase, partial [Clostridiaceae bacterium]|nr:SDR family NAD(P)-dependent oxidoreductase [Clostridiaceae bacterium]
MIAENAESCAKEIVEAGGKAVAFVGNIAKEDDVNATFDLAIKTYGKIDIVVNNAGMNRDCTLVKMDNEKWDSVIAVNLTGTFYMTR